MKRHSRTLVLGVAAAIIILAAAPGRYAGAAQAKQVTFTGKVLDAAGRPLAGVQIRLYRETYGEAAYSSEITTAAETKAQADGSFSFKVPADSEGRRYGYVVAEKEGLALSFATWDMRADRTFDLTLGEAKPLAGVVVDEGGQPVPEASVSIYILQIGDIGQDRGLSMHLAPRLLTTRTDSAGRFRFANLPGEATAELLVRKTGRATVCTFVPSEYGSRALHHQVGQADIRLAQPVEARIEGSVVQARTGQPVTGITLIATYAGNRPLDGYDPINVKADGTFTMAALPAGQYSLQLAKSSAAPAEWVGADVPVTLKSGEAKTGLKIEVSKGGMLEIAITDAATNQPIEKATASVRGPQSGQWFSATSDAEGVARLRLAPGTYQLEDAYKQGYSREGRPENMTIEEGATKRIAATLTETPKVRGVVRDPNGAPVAGVQVRIMPSSYEYATSDAEGRFEVAWDRRGWGSERTTFCLLARHEPRNFAAVVDIGEGKDPLEVRLEPGVVIVGRVADPNGKAIAGARINTMLQMSNWGATMTREQLQTDGSGNFAVRAVPARHQYAIYASADGYGSKRSEKIDTDAARQGRLDMGVVTLPVANLSVSGQVVDLQGEPVANATIAIQGEGQPGRSDTRTDAQGRFTLQGVCAGPANLEVSASRAGRRLSARVLTEGGSSAIRIVVREGNTYMIQRAGGKKYEQIIAGAGKVIAGVAVDEKGSPVANVPVRVCCHKTTREGKTSWMFASFQELSATTDSQGRFAIELKEDGEYNLLFSPDRQAALIVYDVPVGQKDLKAALPEGGTVTGRLLRIEKGQKTPLPNAEVRIEQTSRLSFSHLGFDRDQTTTTDVEGRFRFEHLSTLTRTDHNKAVFIPRTWQLVHGQTVQTLAFDEDEMAKEVDLVIKPDLAAAAPLAGRPLPGFDGIKVDLTPAQIAGKRVLVCFFDWEQRPSRNCVMQLAQQAPALQEKGIAVAAVHVSKDNDAALRTWATDSKIPFPVGTIQGDRDGIFFAWSAKSLPWLVLTDVSHIVTAEGFPPGELDKKLAETPPANR